MENDEPTEWPGQGYSDDGGADLGGADLGGADDGLTDPELTDPELGFEGDEPGDEPGGDEPGGTAFDDAGYELEPESGVPELELTDEPAGDELGFQDPDASDPLIGTDPDADPLADDASWQSDPFPDALDLDEPPEPVDGMPWSDPSLLGDTGADPLDGPTAGYDGSPPVADLYAYDGMSAPADTGSAAWGSLGGSEDPATSSLARFWAPGA